MPTESTTLRSPSIREIARIARVSPSTVSRAFNADDRGSSISLKTREKIAAVCRELNYHPNVHATRLFAGRSNAIGLVVPQWGQVLPAAPSFSDPNLAKTLAGLTEAAGRRKQELVLLSADEAFVESKKYVRVLRSRSVDGLLVWGARPEDQAFIAELVDEGWPVVLVNSFARVPGGPGVPTVQADNRGGGAALARRLIALGHRRIGYLAGLASASAAVGRRVGFEEACREAGVELLIRPGPLSFGAGRSLADELLALPEPPTAIAAVNDLVALGVLEAAGDRGLRIPQDLSVTGADGAFPYHKPRLETFLAPMEELGRRGLALLLDRIAAGQPEGDAAPAHVVLPVDPVAGETVAPPRSG